jgi:predicted GH43/DUF377 family glycosyl hydrolase
VKNLLFICTLFLLSSAYAQNVKNKAVPREVMKKIYEEIKTPYKYGIVLKHPDSTKMVDSPTIFRKDSIWYMTYIVYDGRGYETWLAESADLLNWKTKGRILSFTENTWDANQKAGYMALVDIEWGGSYKVEQFQGKYWMTYLGGAAKGYETGTLGVGMAYSQTLTEAKEWERMPKILLNPHDKESRWFENKTIYKSLIIKDKDKLTGYPFLMYYNAKGNSGDFESIGMAGSKDMLDWKRLGTDPVITKRKGICGDAQIARIGDIYVMFYFGAFWKPAAFERFACSYDLVNWTEWDGEDLIAPSKDFDATYAHKPWVIKWKGIVYHFYTAVGKSGRVIAVAVSKEIKNEEN